MPYKGFIFDFNGTLFWDTPLHDKAWGLFLERHGYSLTHEEMAHVIHGKMNKDILPAISQNQLTQENIAMYADEKELIYRELCLQHGMTLAPGAINLLNNLVTMGVRCAIATASPAVNVHFYIEQFGLHKWFRSNTIICDNGEYRSKPFPDLFIEAAKQINLPPDLCIVAEDSLAGLKAAINARAGKIYCVGPASIITDSSVETISHFDQVDLSLF
ncbi:HAD family hydrolase [Williamwhitmania taraxaci]|uniref:Haloacid dehalogenase superfamily, subfamily IA, variant 3 with third motif having DD or ED n=1 Tax=Williamwhitmania taraxaci TaxID=1640674 RepID=A0A1G6IVT8_9BACT|nr:HAD family phosphatase [Williamwhitmania taraxaci]SDC10598.1 haloacid dehalogenase superfamily, subfamily IA, variant 3 with third motif having DD or ED [Williamwhitmania taraxaci]